MSGTASPTSLNDWFLSLPKGRQDILKDDKWMLAEAAFRAGIELGKRTVEEQCAVTTSSDKVVDGE
jgi:hypothetical protein